MSEVVEKLSERLTVKRGYYETCTCYVYEFDGKEVLQAFRGFFDPESKPHYCTINSFGERNRKNMSKEEFIKRVNYLKSL